MVFKRSCRADDIVKILAVAVADQNHVWPVVREGRAVDSAIGAAHVVTVLKRASGDPCTLFLRIPLGHATRKNGDRCDGRENRTCKT